MSSTFPTESITCTRMGLRIGGGACNRAGESWLPAITTTCRAGFSRTARLRKPYQVLTARAEGLAVWNTSPLTSSTSISSSCSTLRSHPRNAACSRSLGRPCNVWPKCQSEV